MGRRERRTLVDNKGIGKPNTFKNAEKEFAHWARKVELYITGVFPQMEAVLNWATESQESQERVTRAMVLAQFGDDADDLDIIVDVQDLNTQIYLCPFAFTEGESADVVAAVEKGNGVEAWRSLHGRWDPSVTGRSRAILREVINPKRSSLDNVLAKGAGEEVRAAQGQGGKPPEGPGGYPNEQRRGTGARGAGEASLAQLAEAEQLRIHARRSGHVRGDQDRPVAKQLRQQQQQQQGITACRDLCVFAIRTLV